jgi:hypothetical protein
LAENCHCGEFLCGLGRDAQRFFGRRNAKALSGTLGIRGSAIPVVLSLVNCEDESSNSSAIFLREIEICPEVLR